MRRVGDCVNRPLLRELDENARAARLTELLENRQAAYLSAGLVVKTDSATVGAVVDEIARGLEAATDSEGIAS
jgi:shikimate kinase